MLVLLVAFQCDEPALRLLGAIGALPWCPYALHVGSRPTLVASGAAALLQLAQMQRVLRRRRMVRGKADEPLKPWRPSGSSRSVCCTCRALDLCPSPKSVVPSGPDSWRDYGPTWAHSPSRDRGGQPCQCEACNIAAVVV